MDREPGHPSYANPSIGEALCEIMFEGGEAAGAATANFFLRIKDDYPQFEPLAVPQGLIQIVATPPGAPVQQVPAQTSLTKFVSVDGRFTCVIGQNVFRVHRAAPYPGWDVMIEEIAKLWGVMVDVAQPGPLTRVGLRYINVIDVTGERGALGDFILPTKTIPESAVSGSLEHPFSSRTEVWLDEKNTLTLLLARGVGPKGEVAIILDIDRVDQAPASDGRDLGQMRGALDQYHEHVWTEFKAACGHRLRERLSGKVE